MKPNVFATRNLPLQGTHTGKKKNLKKLGMVYRLDRANPHLTIATQIIPLQFS